MIKKYKIKEYPQQIKEVISIDNISDIVSKDGFLVFVLNSLNPEETNDLVEMLGQRNIDGPIINCVVSNCDLSVYEVVKKLEKNGFDEEANNKTTD